MILPAIDLKSGRSVRLYQGDYDKEMVINPDPLIQVREIEAAGLDHLHLVDLDGAKAGQAVNLETIQKIRKQSKLFIELGGGIRTMEQIDSYLSLGINRVILGSVALKNPALVKQALEKYGPDKIVVGVDGRDGKVATEGWLTGSEQTFDEIIAAMSAYGVRNFIVTDISRDGTLAGPNIDFLLTLQKKFPTSKIIASGGIASLADVKALQAVGLDDIIVGRALYDGQLTLAGLKEAEDDAK
ncbi:1-(5-phosphoribosyl)-5-[(5-phosphoribosylamino)methylideneamino]imidazole-4-carboxamide isomerase [Eupransor demetentiae]|uniref:1-(5-phosphoribosyl)-5-[(5-phosphoribosylamino)methylideneamino] imidazole-4-carboxamide isomerase n=1 Tax=Eupransor demetentiae TaxID=3109584 RepID=A0ABM9N371_9LACO|nr:Phosphoribosylformimino-5-aminoimidazole carboxamide ribonucleotide (ProFAR) isomerase (HisA) [Lactobacillaceae bacterium LMG 33000]